MTKKFTGHADVIGQGPPLLFIPGFGNSNWVFQRLAQSMKDRFQCILPDNRGMGKSPPASGPYSLDNLAADILDLMDDLGHERFGVVGLSMGGFIAQLLALRASERVGGLALLCTTSGGDEFKRIFPSMNEEQVRAIYAMDPKARVEAALSPTICPVLQSKYPEVYDYIVDLRSQQPENPVQVMLQFFAVSGFMEKTLPLETIQCPTLILSGELDLLVPQANAELLRDKIPNSRMEVIEDVDHLFILEKNGEVADRLSRFFA